MMKFSVLRNGLTATSANVDVASLDIIRRFLISSIRLSACDTNKYHFIGVCSLQDISGTDTLEEISATVTGTIFKIINKREISGSHIEFDLEPIKNG